MTAAVIPNPVVPPPVKPEHEVEVAALIAEHTTLPFAKMGEQRRMRRINEIWERLVQISPVHRWLYANPKEAVGPNGEQLFHVRTYPHVLGDGESGHHHYYSTVMNAPKRGKQFGFDSEGVGYELRGLDWETGEAKPEHFEPIDWAAI